MYEEITQGYQHCDKVICHRCIGDKALSSYIKANGTRRECSYCHKKNTSVSFDDFMGRIMEGVEFMYSRAADELPVDKGEYVGKTYTSSEIVHNTIADTDNCYAMHFPDSLYFTGIIVLFVVLLSWKNSHCCIDFSREVMYNASSGLLRESRTNRK